MSARLRASGFVPGCPGLGPHTSCSQSRVNARMTAKHKQSDVPACCGMLTTYMPAFSCTACSYMLSNALISFWWCLIKHRSLYSTCSKQHATLLCSTVRCLLHRMCKKTINCLVFIPQYQQPFRLLPAQAKVTALEHLHTWYMLQWQQTMNRA